MFGDSAPVRHGFLPRSTGLSVCRTITRPPAYALLCPAWAARAL